MMSTRALRARPSNAPRVLPVRHQLAGLAGLALLRAIVRGDGAAQRRARAAQHALAALGGRERTRTLRQWQIEIEAGYREWAPTYDQPNILVTLEQREVLRLLADVPVGTAVDAGCGTGRYARRLLARGYAVVGVDRAAAMLAIAARRCPGARFLQADIRRLPLASGSSSLVVCALTLGHVARTGPALREFARVLAHGGSVVVSDLHPFSATFLGWRAGFTRASGQRAFITSYPHAHAEYVRAFTSAGLAVDRYVEPTIGAPASDRYAQALGASAYGVVIRDALVGLPALQIWRARKA